MAPRQRPPVFSKSLKQAGRTVLLGGLCLGLVEAPERPEAPPADAPVAPPTPWYHRPAPWQGTALQPGWTFAAAPAPMRRGASTIFTEQTGANNPLSAIAFMDGTPVPTFVDIDNDGDLDAFIGGAGGDFLPPPDNYYGQILFFRNDDPSGDQSQPTFVQDDAANPVALVDVGDRAAPVFADIDSDGDADLIVGTDAGTFSYFENTGSASLARFRPRTGALNPFDGFSTYSNATPALVDIDGDGDLDLFSGTDGGFSVEAGGFLFFRNDDPTIDKTDPTYTEVIGAANPLDGFDVGNRSHPAFFDCDGDGDFDMVSGEFFGGGAEPFLGEIFFFENTGDANTPAFIERTGAANPFDAMDRSFDLQPAFADINGDGKVDFFIGTGSNSATDGMVNFFLNDTSLPVEMTAFQARLDGAAAVLQWTTASEERNAGFTVEHAAPGVEGWQALGFVEGRGTTQEAQHYQFRMDGLAPGRHRFRLRQMDFDGSFALSAEVELFAETPNTFVLSPAYPNPFNPRSQFSVSVREGQEVRVTVYDALGRQMVTLHDGFLAAHTEHTFYIDAVSWPSGLYVYEIAGAAFREVRSVMLVK